MIIVAHRGLTEGPCEKTENSPEIINNAINQGFDVEVDIWYIDGDFFFGHDNPQYDANEYMKNIKNPEKYWFHAKNVEAVSKLIDINLRVFYHTDEEIVMTSKQELWSVCGKKHQNSMLVLPEVSGIGVEKNDNILGVCTDYAIKWQKELNK